MFLFILGLSLVFTAGTVRSESLVDVNATVCCGHDRDNCDCGEGACLTVYEQSDKCRAYQGKNIED